MAPERQYFTIHILSVADTAQRERRRPYSSAFPRRSDFRAFANSAHLLIDLLGERPRHFVEVALVGYAVGKTKFAHVGQALDYLLRIEKRRVLFREKTQGLDNFVPIALVAWFELTENIDCPLRIVGERATRCPGDPGDNGFFGTLGRRQNAFALKLREASAMKLFPA